MTTPREYLIRWNDDDGTYDLTLFGKHVVSSDDIETLITFSCYSPVRISLFAPPKPFAPPNKENTR